MDPLIQAVIGSAVRGVLTSLAGYLVAHHLLTSDQSDAFVTKALAYFLAALPGIVAFAWSLWQKYKSRLKLIAANQLPPGASEEQIAAKSTTPAVKAQVLTGALVLVLMVVAVPAHAQQPVSTGPDVASYITAGVNPAVAAYQDVKAKDWCRVGQLAITEAVTNTAVLTLKHFIVSPRPCLGCAPDGFPSGHSANSMAGFTAFDWRIGLAIGLTTGALREDAHRHTPGQIFAGLGIGLLGEGAGHLLRCQ